MTVCDGGDDEKSTLTFEGFELVRLSMGNSKLCVLESSSKLLSLHRSKLSERRGTTTTATKALRGTTSASRASLTASHTTSTATATTSATVSTKDGRADGEEIARLEEGCKGCIDVDDETGLTGSNGLEAEGE